MYGHKQAIRRKAHRRQADKRKTPLRGQAGSFAEHWGRRSFVVIGILLGFGVLLEHNV